MDKIIADLEVFRVDVEKIRFGLLGIMLDLKIHGKMDEQCEIDPCVAQAEDLLAALEDAKHKIGYLVW